jgi:hypothetical protein
MAERVASSLFQFRESFRVVNKDVLRWFPGHMGKGRIFSSYTPVNAFY